MTSRTKLAAILAAGIAFGAAVPAMAADKPLLVFVPNGPSDFWQAAVAGLKKAQAELPGFKLELEYPQQATVAAQQQLMEEGHHGVRGRSQDLHHRAEQDRLRDHAVHHG
jgi:ribose transport system substrate-binding protein